MLSNRQIKIVRVKNMGDVAKQAVEFGPIAGSGFIF